MADALNDSGLKIAPVPMDPDEEDEDLGGTTAGSTKGMSELF